MRLKLTLSPKQPKILPFNYQYPLSAAIYRIIQRADEQYADFLHKNGYQHQYHGKSFKLFTFSDLRTPFKILGDRLIITGDTAELLVCFHIPEASSNFVKGLFIDQQLEVADRHNKVCFRVLQVEAIPASPSQEELTLQPLSPLVCGRKNQQGHYDFLSPFDEGFASSLTYSWLEKYRITHNGAASPYTQNDITIKTRTYKNHPPKSRLISIKQNTPAETKIRGYTHFHLVVKAPRSLLELSLNSGLGIYNSQGMGCVGAVDK